MTVAELIRALSYAASLNDQIVLQIDDSSTEVVMELDLESVTITNARAGTVGLVAEIQS